jgi:hypothetical protein
MAHSDDLHSDGPSKKTFEATTAAHYVSDSATDRDQQDYDQLARLGKKSVLKVRRRLDPFILSGKKPSNTSLPA